MTSATETFGSPPPTGTASQLVWAVRDGLAMTGRNLTHYVRLPQLIVFAAVQPVMFVLLFRYVFGGAIEVPGGGDYVNYLLPGVFGQTVVFGAMATGIGLADDMSKGAIDRFRSLPMARSAVLVGRTTADLVRGLFTTLLMTAVGFAVGFRIGTNAWAFAAGILLLLAFSYALMWGFAILGLTAADPETAQYMGFPFLMPLVFASSAFVPVESMPGWLQAFTERQPVTAVVDAARALMLGGPTAGEVVTALVWIVGLLAVLAPIAIWRYRRSS